MQCKLGMANDNIIHGNCVHSSELISKPAVVVYHVNEKDWTIWPPEIRFGFDNVWNFRSINIMIHMCQISMYLLELTNQIKS